jgi:hypothetical protein
MATTLIVATVIVLAIVVVVTVAVAVSATISSAANLGWLLPVTPAYPQNIVLPVKIIANNWQ